MSISSLAYTLQVERRPEMMKNNGCRDVAVCINRAFTTSIIRMLTDSKLLALHKTFENAFDECVRKHNTIFSC